MDKYEFEVDSLDYGTIESKIVDYYDLGYADSSNFNELEIGVHGGYHISAAKGIIEFSSIVGRTKNNTYIVTISPKKISKDK